MQVSNMCVCVCECVYSVWLHVYVCVGGGGVGGCMGVSASVVVSKCAVLT